MYNFMYICDVYSSVVALTVYLVPSLHLFLKGCQLPRVLCLGGMAGKRFLRWRQVTKIWFRGKRKKSGERWTYTSCRVCRKFGSSPAQTKQQTGQGSQATWWKV